MAKVFCGIDWAEGHHDVALVDEDGKLLAKKRFHETLDGWQQLLDLLAVAGDSADAPIPVAIETPRGLLVAALRVTGRPIYAINPMAVARYRDRHTVARSKSDHADAVVLANILRTDAHVHRTLPDDTELARAIAVLARAHQDATWRRTTASNEPTIEPLSPSVHVGARTLMKSSFVHKPRTASDSGADGCSRTFSNGGVLGT